MKILLHSNGIPQFEAGGYNSQIRKLIKGFTDRGNEVRYLCTGYGKASDRDMTLYQSHQIQNKFELSIDQGICKDEETALRKIGYYFYQRKQGGPFIDVKIMNRYIQDSKAEYLFSLCDALIHFSENSTDNFQCPSTIWWPCHYNPPDPASIHSLNLFTNIITLCPSVETILREIFPHKNIRTCPHIVEYPNIQKLHRHQLREEFNLPKDSFMVLVNGMFYEKSNRKSIDTTMAAFRDYLEINPNAFLYIQSSIYVEIKVPVTFTYPDNTPPGQNIQVTVKGIGLVNIPTEGKNYKVGESYTEHLPLKKKHITRQEGNLMALASAIGIPQSKIFVNHTSITSEKLLRLYQASDLLLSPSKSEGFGIPILEAQLAGTPVITTDFLAMADYTYYGISVPPIQEQCNISQNGIWAQPSIKGITQAIDTVFNWPEEKHHTLRTKAHSLIEAQMSNQRVLNILSSVMGLHNALPTKTPSPTEIPNNEVLQLLCPKSILRLGPALDWKQLPVSVQNIYWQETLGKGPRDNHPEKPVSLEFQTSLGDNSFFEVVILDGSMWQHFSDTTWEMLINYVNPDTLFILENSTPKQLSDIQQQYQQKSIIPIKIRSGTSRIFRLSPRVFNDPEILPIDVCFVWSSEPEDETRYHRYPFPVRHFTALQGSDLEKLESWRQKLIAEGTLSYKTTINGADEVAKFVGHRTLWSHILENDGDWETALVLSKPSLLDKGIPLECRKSDLVFVRSDSNSTYPLTNSYIVTKNTCLKLLEMTRPISGNIEQVLSTIVAPKLTTSQIIGPFSEPTNRVVINDPVPDTSVNTKEADKSAVGETENITTDNVTDRETDKSTTGEVDNVITGETDKSTTVETDKLATAETDNESAADTDKVTTSETDKLNLDNNSDNNSDVNSACSTEEPNDNSQEQHLVDTDKTTQNVNVEMSIKKSQPVRSKIAVLTVCLGEGYSDGLQTCLKSKETYCKKHNYDFIQGGSDVAESKVNPTWSKWRLIQRHLPKYDYIFYSDADVMFLDQSTPLTDFLEKYLHQDKFILCCTSETSSTSLNIDSHSDQPILQAGNFFIKNDISTLTFCEEIYGLRQKYATHCMSDQAALNDFYYLHHDNQTLFSLIQDNRVFNSTFPLPQTEKCISCYQPGDFLVHFQGWRSPLMIELFSRQVLSLANLANASSEDEHSDFSGPNDYYLPSKEGGFEMVMLIPNDGYLFQNAYLNRLYCERHSYGFKIIVYGQQNPFSKLHTYMKTTVAKYLLVTNPLSLISNTDLELLNIYDKVGNGCDLVTTHQMQMVELPRTSKPVQSLTLSSFIIKKTTWSKQFLSLIGGAEAPVQIMNNEYYGDENISRKHIQVVANPKTLRSTLFSNSIDGILLNTYTPGDFLIDFEGWNLAVIPWLIDFYGKAKNLPNNQKIHANLGTSTISDVISNNTYQVKWTAKQGLEVSLSKQGK